jgi:hypothetical protein
MKLILHKGCIGLAGLFATYYLFFLSSIFYELYGPSSRFCGTAQVWALQGRAMLFAPTAVLSTAGLWFLARGRPVLGRVFFKVSKVSRALLLLCAFVNLIIFLPVF